jgi:ferredoxin
MMDAMKALLHELGVPSAQIRSESFGAAMKLVADADADTAPAPPPRAATASRTVRFARTGCDARIAPTQTILEAAEARGVELPSSCRAGTCHTCRTRLMAGNVDCLSDSLSAEDRAAGFILPCVSHARSDCELEA